MTGVHARRENRTWRRSAATRSRALRPLLARAADALCRAALPTRTNRRAGRRRRSGSARKPRLRRTIAAPLHSFDDVAAQQELAERDRADKPDHREQQRRLEIYCCIAKDSRELDQCDQIDDERVEGENPVDDIGPAEE